MDRRTKERLGATLGFHIEEEAKAKERVAELEREKAQLEARLAKLEAEKHAEAERIVREAERRAAEAERAARDPMMQEVGGSEIAGPRIVFKTDVRDWIEKSRAAQTSMARALREASRT